MVLSCRLASRRGAPSLIGRSRARFPLLSHLPACAGLTVVSTGVYRLRRTGGDEVVQVDCGVVVAVEYQSAGLAGERALGQRPQARPARRSRREAGGLQRRPRSTGTPGRPTSAGTTRSATWRSDLPLHDVQDAAGHADPRTTQRYNRARHPAYALAGPRAV